MKNFIFTLLFLGTLNISHLLSQDLICASTFTEDQKSILIDNKSKMNQSHERTDILIYVPIVFHLIGEADGAGRVPFEAIMDQLCELNAVFARFGYKFYMKNGEIQEVNNNTMYFMASSSAGTSKLVSQKNEFGTNALNVFVTENADNGGLGQTLAYYSFNQDLIVMRKSVAQNETQDHFVLPHEIGHFFSLDHTFNGWDRIPWDGEEITDSISPGGQINELANGANCNTAGDLICDTPADYNLGFGWDGCRPYDGGCKDLTGNLLDPAEDNLMGYFIGCNEYKFSDDQKKIIDQDYLSSRRSYLRVSYEPADLEVTEKANLIGPDDGSTIPFFNGVELNWSPVENATHYFIELTQGLFKKRYIVETNKIFLTDLLPDKNYRWRVVGYNEVNTCAPSSGLWQFRTGSSTTSTKDESYSEKDLKISPNPSFGNNIRLDWNSDYLGELNIEILSTNGKIVFKNKIDKNDVILSYLLENLNINNGFYILKLNFGDRILTKKVIIND